MWLASPNPNLPLTVVLLQLGDSVNAKCEKGYYGAFITCVNTDMTYNVYFTEDPDCDSDMTDNIPHKHIKKPIQTPRQTKFSTWYKYYGKVFYDEDTKKGEDDKDPDYCLEAGEWVVDSLAPENTFLCLRLGQPHDDANNLQFDIGYVMRRIHKYEEE